MKHLAAYNPYGPKQDEYLPYQRLRFLEKNLELYSQSENNDIVDEYSVALGKLYKWVMLAIEVRK